MVQSTQYKRKNKELEGIVEKLVREGKEREAEIESLRRVNENVREKLVVTNSQKQAQMSTSVVKEAAFFKETQHKDLIIQSFQQEIKELSSELTGLHLKNYELTEKRKSNEAELERKRVCESQLASVQQEAAALEEMARW